jgi:hypothetical protein
MAGSATSRRKPEQSAAASVEAPAAEAEAEPAEEVTPGGPIGTHGAAASAAAVVTAPVAIARKAVHASGEVPYYVALGGLAVAGVVDWPVAAAIGATYWLLRRGR